MNYTAQSETAQLKAQLNQLRQEAEEKQAAKLIHATVLDVSADRKKLTMGLGGMILEASNPQGLGLKPGDVALADEAGNIVTKGPQPPLSGLAAKVVRVISPKACEVEAEGAARVVLTGSVAVAVGDRVVVDTAHSIVRAKLPPEDAQALRKTNIVHVEWDAVGAQNEAKEAIEDALILPFLHEKIFAHYGQVPPRGCLLWGKPGNGKTLLAKAVATRLAGGGDGGFVAISGPEVLDPFVGKSEANVRAAFAACRIHAQATGKPAVLFVDEAEAILARRDSGRSSDILKTIVPTFLTEMDGLSVSNTIVLLATNRPDVLDEAVIRDGRIDRKVEIKAPDAGNAGDVLRIHMRGAPIKPGETAEALIETAVHEVYSAGRKIGAGNKVRFLSEVVSGAMLAAIVNHGKRLAIRRDLESPGRKPSGLSVADMSAAIDLIQRENSSVTHA